MDWRMRWKKTGGPAFPQQHDATGSEGMTLRDYFAAKSVGHYLLNSTDRDAVNAGMEIEQFAAVQAYMLADAMLMARGEE